MVAEVPRRWIRIAGLGLAALLFGCTPGAGSRDPSGRLPSALPAPPAPPALRAVPGEFLVKFKSGAPRAAVTRAFGKAALVSSHEFRSVPGL